MHYCVDSNGVIILTATGGPSETNGISDAYMFSIDGGSTFVMGSNPMRFDNLAAGFYDIVVVDTNFMGVQVKPMLILDPTQI